MTHSQHNPAGERGYTLLFAVLVSSVVLAMGLSILSISRKEVILSSASRESVAAFYAADAGLECALYWDQYGMFATSTPGPTAPARSITCGSTPPITTGTTYPDGSVSRIGGGGNTNGVSHFIIDFTLDAKDPQPYCSVVEVTKFMQSGVVQTIIDSKGYNTCDPENPRRVERALVVRPS
jgi:hypothetical protein